MQYAAAEIMALLAATGRLSTRLQVLAPGAAVAVEMARAALSDAAVRLGVPLAGETENAEDDPLVLGVQPGVRSQ